MAYLDDHKPASQQFRDPRREAPSGVVVVHTAENTPDFVAFDGGAESVANFIAGRPDPGSYHDLVDSDSRINLVRYECEAFHDATGSNRHSYGVSVATRADVWPLAPERWRKGAVTNAARAAAIYAHWLHSRSGIIIPASRINRDQSEARKPGFISHHERDPARRTDPGAAFPWQYFLDKYTSFMADLLHHPIPHPQEEEMRIYDCQGKPALLFANGTHQKLTKERRDFLRSLNVTATVVTPEQWEVIASFPAAG